MLHDDIQIVMKDTLNTNQLLLIQNGTEPLIEAKNSVVNREDLKELSELGFVTYEYETFPKRHFLCSLTCTGNLFRRALMRQHLESPEHPEPKSFPVGEIINLGQPHHDGIFTIGHRVLVGDGNGRLIYGDA